MEDQHGEKRAKILEEEVGMGNFVVRLKENP